MLLWTMLYALSLGPLIILFENFRRQGDERYV